MTHNVYKKIKNKMYVYDQYAVAHIDYAHAGKSDPEQLEEYLSKEVIMEIQKWKMSSMLTAACWWYSGVWINGKAIELVVRKPRF